MAVDAGAVVALGHTVSVPPHASWHAWQCTRRFLGPPPSKLSHVGVSAVRAVGTTCCVSMALLVARHSSRWGRGRRFPAAASSADAGIHAMNPFDDGDAASRLAFSGSFAPDADDEAAPLQRGLAHWRGKQSNAPKTTKVNMITRTGGTFRLPIGSIEDMIKSGSVRKGIPLHSLALVSLLPEDMLCPGEVRSLRIEMEAEGVTGGGAQLAAFDYAERHDGGLVGCIANIEDTNGMPWGAVACEVMGAVRCGSGEALVTLKAVANVRLISSAPVSRSRGFVVALVQEVPEWGPSERAAGMETLQEDVKELERLFDSCGELQRLGAALRAGDFASQTFADRHGEILEALGSVPLLVEPPSPGAVATVARAGIGGATNADDVAEALASAPEGATRLVAAAHAIVAALSPEMQVKFLCDPVSLAPRLKRLRELLSKVEQLVRARHAFRQAFDD